ncbi:MAG: elongation factor G, partial [Candidatus Cloacimonetes bacterium]|nr:elongation factor G [Candidatus Cloacimonadota bacterium]
ITSATVACQWHENQINIIDTPGHVDFTAEVERSLRVLDGAVGIFCGVGGVEPQSETVWHQAERYQVPRLAFVNKLDRLGADYERVISMIHDRLTSKAVPINIPLGREENFSAIIDLVTMKVFRFDPNSQGFSVQKDEIPDDHLEKAQLCREVLIEAVAEFDDELMTCYLEGEAIPDNVLKRAIRKGTIRNQLVPVLCGSSLKNKGVQLLLDAICDYLPSPLDKPSVEGFEPKTHRPIPIECDPRAQFVALAFKVQIDKYVGKLIYIRVYSGLLKKGDTYLNQTTGKRERVSRILQMMSNRKNDLEQLHAGDIGAIVGPKQTITGDTITSDSLHVLLSRMHFPDTVISIAIEPKTKADQDALKDALVRLEEEDPTFNVRVDKETGQTLISGMGELHLDIIVDRLRREFNVQANVGTPQVSYKETITKAVTTEEVFQRDMNGKVNYARVVVAISPVPLSKLSDGSKNVFVNRVAESVIPSVYWKAIEESAMNSLNDGPLINSNVERVKVELIGGSFDQLNSSEMAFHIATSMAVNSALREAEAVIMEPVMLLSVLTPDEFVGDIIGDINSKRGKVDIFRRHNEFQQEIVAEVPLNELFGYATRIRSLSQGRAIYTLEFKKYEIATPSVQANVLKRIRGY